MQKMHITRLISIAANTLYKGIFLLRRLHVPSFAVLQATIL
jgi:hypothetical protein